MWKHERIISLRRKVCALKTSLIPPCLYQARKVDVHVFVCYEDRFRLFLWFFYWNFNCSNSVLVFVFHFIWIICCREESCQAKTGLDELKEMSDTQKEKQDRMIKEYVYIFNCYWQVMYGDDHLHAIKVWLYPPGKI